MGRLKVEGPMRPGPVVVLDVDADHALQVTPSEDEDVVETLLTNGAYPVLRERVRLRRPDGRPHYCQSFRSEDLVEASGERGVSISEQDVLVIETSGDHQVPCLLSDPGASRADWSNSRRGPPCRELDEEQDVEGLQEHGLQGEEVACDHSPPLCSNDGSYAAFGTGDGRIYGSDDGGLTWLELITGLPPVQHLLLVPD
jgi:hypothetical protein